MLWTRGLLYASHSPPPFLSKNVFKHDPMPIESLCVGYVVAGNASLSGFIELELQIQSSSLLETAFEE